MTTPVTGANIQAILAAAKNGDAGAQGAIGLAYLEGKVTIHDFDPAVKIADLKVLE